MAFHKDVLIECGGFAVNRGPVGGSYRMGEDTEAVLRVAARHPRVWYDPSLTVEHWVPMEKMTLYHLMQRRYLSGVAMSELEHTVLLSRRSLAVLVARMRRHLVRKTDVSAVRGAVDHVTSPSSLPPGSQRLLVGIISCALWLTEKVGRIRGARLLRLCRHRPACPTSLPL